jgi:hypothetical protein
VRSTTQRYRPSRSEGSMPRRASRGVMPRARSASRRSVESYALSPCSLVGRLRGRPGRPRAPMIGGMASTNGRSWVPSWALAAERRTAKGMPFRSTTRWYLEPGLPRSTGFGPVASLPFWPGRSKSRRSPGPSRWTLHRPTSPEAARVGAAKLPLPANRATVASRWCHYHSRVPSGATATDSPCARQRRCQ